MVVSKGAVQMMKATLDACVIPKAVFRISKQPKITRNIQA